MIRVALVGVAIYCVGRAWQAVSADCSASILLAWLGVAIASLIAAVGRR